MPEGLGFDLFLIFSDPYELFGNLNQVIFKVWNSSHKEIDPLVSTLMTI